MVLRSAQGVCLSAPSSTEAAIREVRRGATEEPEVIPDPAKQTDRVVIAGVSAAVLVFILLLLVAILLVKK
ncbi:receptor-type tyrosine-protein phosphatase kappa isoform X1, partial [Tachysurus ichikawai]